jgi:hypothetical protein
MAPTPVHKDETGPDERGDPKQPNVSNRMWVGGTRKWRCEAEDGASTRAMRKDASGTPHQEKCGHMYVFTII